MNDRYRLVRWHAPGIASSAFWLLWYSAIAFATLEIAARIDDWVSYGASPWQRYEFEDLFRQTERGLEGVPNGRYVRWMLNSRGIRGPEIGSDEGHIRVVTYGASETFGIYESPNMEYPRELERILNERNRLDRFEVINAGIPGMRVGSGIQLLRELGAELKPAVVVIYPTPTHYIGVTRPYCGRPPRPKTAPGFTFSWRIFDKTKDKLKAVLPDSIWMQVREAGIAWAVRSGRTKVLDRVDLRSLDAFQTDLKCAVNTVREIGAVPILATHANRFNSEPQPADRKWLVGWRMQYPELKEEGFIDLEARANSTIAKVAKDENVPLADAARSLNANPLNFADHAHFSDEGSTRMAELLADTIASLRM